MGKEDQGNFSSLYGFSSFFLLFFASTIILVPFQSSHAPFYGDSKVHPKFAFHYNIGNELGYLFLIPFEKPKGASSPNIHDNMPK
jgi:hypothetical protein